MRWPQSVTAVTHSLPKPRSGRVFIAGALLLAGGLAYGAWQHSRAQLSRPLDESFGSEIAAGRRNFMALAGPFDDTTPTFGHQLRFDPFFFQPICETAV